MVHIARGGGCHQPSRRVEPHIFQQYGKWLLGPRKDLERRVQAAEEGGEEKQQAGVSEGNISAVKRDFVLQLARGGASRHHFQVS